MDPVRTGSRVPVVRSLPAPGTYACGLTFDGHDLWYSDQEAGKLVGLDRGSGAVKCEFACSRVRADLAYHDRLLCQVGGRPKRIILVDSRTGEVVGEKPVRPPSGRLCGVEMSPDGLWMCLRAPAVLQLRDFETMTVLRELAVEGAPSGLTYVDGTVLYGEFETGALRAVDATTGTLLASVTVEGHPTGMTWDGDQVWYCDFQARAIKAISLADVRP